MTSVAAASETSWNGAAIVAACMLGEFAGRKPLVVSFATSPRDGRNRVARYRTTILARTTRNRKRTVKRPRLAKKWLTTVLSRTRDCGAATVRTCSGRPRPLGVGGGRIPRRESLQRRVRGATSATRILTTFDTRAIGIGRPAGNRSVPLPARYGASSCPSPSITAPLAGKRL